MTIAELFVELGIKGSEKTVQGLKSVRNGLGDLKTMSLETKAAIAAAVYGLQHMMSQSAQMGTGLTNFTALTGLSAKTLQQWQYAARQAGVSGEELTGSLKAVQQGMTNMLMGKGAPEGMGLLANKVGFDPKRARDTFYVMEQLQKFARSGVSNDMANTVMKSFGLSEGTIAAMRRQVFTPAMFAKAPTYSEGETKQLDRVNVAWSNLGNKIQMAFGRFTSKHGMQLVSDISKITDQVVRLADAFMRLADKLKFFQGIAKVFEGWSMIFNGITNTVNDISSDKGGVLSGMWKKTKEVGAGAMDAYKGMQIEEQERIQAMIQRNAAEFKNRQGGTSNTNTLTVNQNLNFQHDGKDHAKTSKSVNDAVQKAYRQNSALKGGY